MPGLRGFTGSLAILWNDRRCFTGRGCAWREPSAAPHAARPVGGGWGQTRCNAWVRLWPGTHTGRSRWGDGMGIHDLWLFVIAGLLLNITPGPTGTHRRAERPAWATRWNGRSARRWDRVFRSHHCSSLGDPKQIARRNHKILLPSGTKLPPTPRFNQLWKRYKVRRGICSFRKRRRVCGKTARR